MINYIVKQGESYTAMISSDVALLWQSQSYNSISAVEIPSVPIPLKGSSELGHPLWERFRSEGETYWNATWQHENAFWRLHQNVLEGIATCHKNRPLFIFIAEYGGSAFSCVSNKRQHKKLQKNMHALTSVFWQNTGRGISRYMK